MSIFWRQFLSSLAIIVLFSVLVLFVTQNPIYLTLILIPIALLLAFFSSEQTSRTINRIIEFTQEIAKGNFNSSVPVAKRRGDLSELSLALSEMADNLDKSFKRLSHEQSRLGAVLGAMTEGVMVVSGRGKVVLVNTALKEMFSINEDPSGKPYWEITRNREISDIIERTLKRREPESREISLLYPEEKYYMVSVYPLDSNENDVIAVIFDVTDFKRLEKIKADFVANVSHELRTPLTAIKGYTETLEEEAYESLEERKHFLGIIKRHTDKLIAMVSDLLVLSEIESKDSLWRENPRADFEEIDFEELVSSSFEALRTKICEKKLQTSTNTEKSLPKFQGNRFLLEQMFINLIDNAVKYTPEGGNVGVDVSKTDSLFRIEVFDTGVGIPKEHIPRIFERFYRVDKTRSSKMGGTGLGLSIVKHTVMMHGGKIDVRSEEDKGSRFIITLPG